MKKLILPILALVMVISVSTISASATTDTMSGPGSKSIDVKAIYVDQVDVPTVYSVNLEWGIMEFTCTATGTKIWNPATNQYDVETSTVWTADGNDITVTNHSNVAVTATFDFSKDASITESITGTFSIESKLLNAGVVGGYDTADRVTSTLTINGALDSSKTEFTRIGTVTVTIQ